ncbi:MAG: hypothetical protein LAP38_10335 [Acidobacteriia bacterium]|nr:hypothetical protein [Terriglobia bacterium]
MFRFFVAGLSMGMLGMAADAPAPSVTFAKEVSRIFQQKCNECHRPGTAAPMSLETYDAVRPWARSIKQRVLMRQMPPWSIDKSVGIQEFSNDRSLTEDELSTIVRWVDAGSPLGNPKDLPAPQKWSSDEGWQLAKQFGPPDFVLKSDPYTMPAQSQDQWWKPLADVPVTEARWVRAVEMRPGTAQGRKITHHALAHLVQDDPEAQRLGVDNDAAAGQGGVLMEWAVGKNFDIFREGTGKLVMPGSHIWWDIHYHAVGEEIRDHVELGVWLYPKGQEPKYRTYLTGFQATSTVGAALDIAPNSISMSQGFHVLKQAARLENFQPHMHLRGKAMLLEAILPDGTNQTISYVGNFDFNWMTNYIYTDEAAPVLPKGTIIHVTAWHDNTASNRGNPDPNQWVGWGDRTVDEMAHAWVNVTYISDDDYQAWAAKHKPQRTGMRRPE